MALPAVLVQAHIPDNILTPHTRLCLVLVIMRKVATFWKRAHVREAVKVGLTQQSFS